MRLRIAWDRSSLTIDLTRSADDAEPQHETQLDALVERAEAHPIGFVFPPRYPRQDEP